MHKLNEDTFHLIFEEFELHELFRSCLLVNKTWCKIIIPALWKDPWKYLKKRREKLLLNVIISHLSDKMRNYLSQKIDFLKKPYKKPLFNYISFCKNLNLCEIERII